MLNKIDPGRRLRAKFENMISALWADVPQAVLWFVPATLICICVFKVGYNVGLEKMHRDMVRKYNLVIDCEVVVIPSDKNNNTELYQLCD